MKNEVKIVQARISVHVPWRLPRQRSQYDTGEPVLCADKLAKHIIIPRGVKALVLVFSDTAGVNKFKFIRNTRDDRTVYHPWIIEGTNRVPLYHQMDLILTTQHDHGHSYCHFEYE